MKSWDRTAGVKQTQRQEMMHVTRRGERDGDGEQVIPLAPSLDVQFGVLATKKKNLLLQGKEQIFETRGDRTAKYAHAQKTQRVKIYQHTYATHKKLFLTNKPLSRTWDQSENYMRANVCNTNAICVQIRQNLCDLDTQEPLPPLPGGS